MPVLPSCFIQTTDRASTPDVLHPRMELCCAHLVASCLFDDVANAWFRRGLVRPILAGSVARRWLSGIERSECPPAGLAQSAEEIAFSHWAWSGSTRSSADSPAAAAIQVKVRRRGPARPDGDNRAKRTASCTIRAGAGPPSPPWKSPEPQQVTWNRPIFGLRQMLKILMASGVGSATTLHPFSLKNAAASGDSAALPYWPVPKITSLQPLS